MTQRQLQLLYQSLKPYPMLNKHLNRYIGLKHAGKLAWPDWCLLPMGGWYAIVSEAHSDQLDDKNALPLALIPEIGRLAAMGTWRYSQGIYTFDKDFYQTLISTPLTKELPADVFYRLPEWCLYIVTPEQTWLNNPLHGFWVHLEHDSNTGRAELRLLLDTDKHLIAFPLHIGAWTLTEAIDRALQEADKHLIAINLEALGISTLAHLTPDLNASLTPLINLILYLCADAPEITPDKHPGTYPHRPNYNKTKDGNTLFPATKPHYWQIGEHIGNTLRQANQHSSSTNSSKKPHLRRGHWHGYWTGKRNEQQTFGYKWLMPQLINASE
jgi:hypothetical protein